MYHLTLHGRTIHSAETIGKGLLQCLQSKPLSEVSVSDIYRATGVSRTTFYRIFDAPDDVLLYLCDKYKQELVETINRQDFSDNTEWFLAPIRYSIQNYPLYKILVQNHRIDLLEDLHRVTVQHLSEALNLFRDLSDVEREYVTAHIYAIMTSTLTTWLQLGRRETPEQLLHYVNIFSNVIRRLFEKGSGRRT